MTQLAVYDMLLNERVPPEIAFEPLYGRFVCTLDLSLSVTVWSIILGGNACTHIKFYDIDTLPILTEYTHSHAHTSCIAWKT